MASADYDLDGDLDIFFTHLMNESNTLYKNNSKGYYQDVSNKVALSRDSFAYTGWATGFLHINEDIYPDLLIFNGAVADTNKSGMAKPNLEQANQLFLGSKSGKFQLVKDDKSLNISKVSRGAAFGDIDNDGDLDVVANNNDAAAEIFINQLNPVKWFGFNRIIDTRIEAMLINEESGLKYQLQLKIDGSYASSQDGRIIISDSQLESFDALNFYQDKKLLKSFKLDTLQNSNSYTTIKLK
jgi:hypothetical protein